MTLCQTLLMDFDEEMKSTRKMLERVPMDAARRTYKPHAKSMQLDHLATHVAQIPGWPKMMLTTELMEVDPATFKPPLVGSRAELLEMFDKAVAEGRAAIAAVSDKDMEKTWTFRFGDQFSMTEPRTRVVRSALNHLVHHRAQIGVYLRLNDIPVPGMYGPSADES